MAALEPSGSIARCSTKSGLVAKVGSVPIFQTKFGEVEGLPEEGDGVVYVVSGLVRTALPERPDLASPSELIRDENGQPVGCKGLVMN